MGKITRTPAIPREITGDFWASAQKDGTAHVTQERTLLRVGSTALILIEAPSPAYRWYAIVGNGNEEWRRLQVMRLRPFHAVIVVNGSRVLPLTRAWH